MQITVPPNVTQNLARAKSLIGRNEPARALEALIQGIYLYEEAKVLGRGRFVVEAHIRECVNAFNEHSRIRSLIREITRTEGAVIAYTPGQEDKLAAVLGILKKALTESATAAEKAAAESLRERKESMFTSARELLASGETPKARAILRRLAEEFEADPGVLSSVGSILVEAGFLPDAVVYLEQAIADFPRDSAAYSTLATCYLDLRENEKAEKLYLGAIREFGAHPQTLTNLGKLYCNWNKRDKAFDVLKQAVRLDPSNEEAAALFAKVDR